MISGSQIGIAKLTLNFLSNGYSCSGMLRDALTNPNVQIISNEAERF